MCSLSIDPRGPISAWLPERTFGMNLDEEISIMESLIISGQLSAVSKPHVSGEIDSEETRTWPKIGTEEDLGETSTLTLCFCATRR